MRPLSPTWLVALALVVGACAAVAPSAGAGSPSLGATASRVPASADLPVLGFDPTGGPSQAPRWITGRWSSSLPLLDVQLTVTPQPGFACAASMDPGRQTGGYSCDGLLPPATDVRLELVATSGQGGHARATRSFRTMAERLSGVPWFTEFEDPNGEALACAAASVRILSLIHI